MERRGGKKKPREGRSTSDEMDEAGTCPPTLPAVRRGTAGSAVTDPRHPHRPRYLSSPPRQSRARRAPAVAPGQRPRGARRRTGDCSRPCCATGARSSPTSCSSVCAALRSAPPRSAPGRRSASTQHAGGRPSRVARTRACPAAGGQAGGLLPSSSFSSSFFFSSSSSSSFLLPPILLSQGLRSGRSRLRDYSAGPHSPPGRRAQGLPLGTPRRRRGRRRMGREQEAEGGGTSSAFPAQRAATLQGEKEDCLIA